MASRVSSSVFVGRQPELALVTAALETPGQGGPGLILIGGEAGVGKTRLIDEIVRRAHAQERPVLVGGCVELGGAGLPFAPITEALRSATRGVSPDALSEIFGPATTELGRLLPELSAPSEPDAQHGVGRGSAQSRLFEAFLVVLRRLDVGRPPLFVIENLHWADRSTLDLLAYLAHSRRDGEFVTIATFRSDELHRRHPLQPFLGEFQRAAGTERLDLRRFERSEVAEQVTAIRGTPVDPDLIDRVYERSEGNAFFTEEVLAADGSAGELSVGIRDVLLAHVATLSDATQALLRIASAAGSRIPTRTLAQVADRQESDLAELLREAVEGHILVPVDDSRDEVFAFRHALVREAVYGELLPGERTRIHGRYAEALASAAGSRLGIHAAELAYHSFAAHDVARALEASILAAEEAEGVRAFGDAHAHFERALEIWESVPDAESRTGLDRIGVLERAARSAFEKAPPRAVSLVAEAIRLADPSADPVRVGLLHEQLGRYAWNAGDGIAALAACREAVRLVPVDPPTLARARATASLAQILIIELQSVDRVAICEEAVAVARAVGASELESHALTSLGLAKFYDGELEAGLADLRDALDIALSVGGIDEAARAYANLVDVLNHGGHLAEAAEAAEKGFAYADAHSARYMGVASLCEGAAALQRLGRWTDATALIERARQSEAPGNIELFIPERLALLDVGQGRHEIAAMRLDRLRVLVERTVEAQWIAPVAEAAAELALWQGRPARAREEILDAFARLPIDEPAYISRLGVLFALDLRAAADESALARARRADAELAETRVVAEGRLAEIRALRDAAVAGFPGFVREAEAWLSLSEAEFARATGANQPAAWAAAAAAFGDIPMAYPRAYALWREADAALAARRPRSRAAEPLRQAHSIATELGAEPLRQELEELAARARIELETPAVQGLDDSAPSDPIGLTAREREVLALVATGLTNRQIGSRLFISESTAGVHVSHVLAKLDAQSRTEAAAVARRLGLIEK